MLFHVTATHTPDDCPGYNHDTIPALIEASKGIPAKAEELSIKILFSVNAAPEHVTFLLLEADDPYSIALLLTEIPFKQDFKVTAVDYQQTVMQRAAEIYGQG